MTKTGSRCMDAVRGLVVLAILLTSASGPASAATTVADQIVEQLVKKFTSLSSLSYTVKRVTMNKDRQIEEKWVFRYKRPDRIRIDSLTPVERLIIMDGKTLFEHIPAAKDATKVHLDKLSAVESDQVVTMVMSRFAVPGLTVENYPGLQGRAAQVSQITMEGRNVMKIEYAAPKHILYIDPAQLTLLRSEIYDHKGPLVLRTEAHRYQQVLPDFWLPREIQVTYGIPDGGFVKSTIYLSDLAAGKELAESLFQVPTLLGIAIRDLN